MTAVLDLNGDAVSVARDPCERGPSALEPRVPFPLYCESCPFCGTPSETDDMCLACEAEAERAWNGGYDER